MTPSVRDAHGLGHPAAVFVPGPGLAQGHQEPPGHRHLAPARAQGGRIPPGDGSPDPRGDAHVRRRRASTRPTRPRPWSISCNKGQGVFAIALDKVWDDLEGDAGDAEGRSDGSRRRVSAEPTSPDELRKSDTVALRPRQRAAVRAAPGLLRDRMGVRAHVVRHRVGRARATCSSGSRPTSTCPTYDLYIEITTLNQKLVTKKNRKVRRLRERYPEIRCKVFYQRDYLSLVTKYGWKMRRADAAGA